MSSLVSCRLLRLLSCLICKDADADESAPACKGSVKVKTTIFGGHLDLRGIRSSEAIEVCWVCRIVKQGRNYEVAPMRPVAILRTGLTLSKNEVVRLV